MGLLSFLKRRRDPATAEPPPPDAPPDAVALARSRARRRLIGATVLLAIGVIGFPLLFETQPRPIAVDIPIEMPQRDKAPPLVLTPAPGAAPTITDPAPPVRVPPPELTERPSDAGQELPAGTARPGASTPATRLAEGAGTSVPPVVPAKPAPEARPAPDARPVAEPRPAEAKPAAEARPAASKPAPAASRPAAATPAATALDSKPASSKPTAAQEAARAQALLEGKAAAAPATDAANRVVVQVGAYTDADKLRQVRAKLEQMGFKTYTQVIDGNGERRTRVRVGPFATRAEADKAAARIKAAGLQAAILSL